MVKITVDFKDAKKFDQLIRYIENNAVYEQAQTAMTALGHKTADNMKDVINSSRKRPNSGTNKLERSIESTTILGISHGGFLGMKDINTFEVGIGEIAKMTKEAPYWEVLDVGGYVPPANYGFFSNGEAPKSGASGQEWVHSGKDSYLPSFYMKPKSPIQGIDYIGQSLRKLRQDLDEEVKNLGAQFINGIKKAS